jgi:uncharacterized membrane protein YfcA
VLWALLGLIGISVGVFGTLIGAAGGFLLVPLLLFLYPQDTPNTITSITLTVAFFNALSGSIAYGRMKRIDYRSGLFFSMTSVPGAIIGASVTAFLSRGIFQIIFGATLIVAAAYLIVRPERKHSISVVNPGHARRQIEDTQGTIYSYSFSLARGMAVAFGVGFLSGLLGIGGGIIHVPVLTQLLGFPTHVATATSHFVVAITTLGAVTFHAAKGAFSAGFGRVAVLSVGAVVGAQFGARLSQRVSGALIIRLLAVGLAIVGVRLLVAPL